LGALSGFDRKYPQNVGLPAENPEEPITIRLKKGLKSIDLVIEEVVFKEEDFLDNSHSRGESIPDPNITKYSVYVDDNFHYMQEDERYTLGVFDTEAEAVEAARNIIDKFLLESYKPGQNAGQLLETYTLFGEDPWILNSTFRAWDYAREKCKEICSQGKSQGTN
jgi:hypothetical protein